MDETSLVAQAAQAESILIASDYDGTLSEIAAMPDAARPAPGALDALTALVAAPNVHVAVVSGRTRDALALQLGRIEGIWRVTEHGAWVERPSGEQIGPALERADRVRLDALFQAASEMAEEHVGVRVERKHTAVAVHVRQVPNEHRAAAIAALGRWSSRAESEGFALVDGRQVLEARWPAFNKATGLVAILSTLAPPPARVIYAGDDTTDEDAFAFVRARGGLAVYVKSAERPRPRCVVDVLVEGPAAWIDVAARIARARAHG